MKDFTNRESDLKKNIPRITLNTAGEIKRIDFLSQGGENIISSYHNGLVSASAKDTELTNEAIIRAGYFLCRVNPHRFYIFYQNIKSDFIKDLLKQAVALVQKEYEHAPHMDADPVLLGDIGPYFWSNSFVFNAAKERAITSQVILSVDSRHLTNAYFQQRNEDKKEFSHIISYDRDLITPYEEVGIMHEPLDISAAKDTSRLLLQGNVEEYLELAKSIDPTDGYYEAIMNGGLSFTKDLDDLEYTIKQR